MDSSVEEHLPFHEGFVPEYLFGFDCDLITDLLEGICSTFENLLRRIQEGRSLLLAVSLFLLGDLSDGFLSGVLNDILLHRLQETGNWEV